MIPYFSAYAVFLPVVLFGSAAFCFLRPKQQSLAGFTTARTVCFVLFCLCGTMFSFYSGDVISDYADSIGGYLGISAKDLGPAMRANLAALINIVIVALYTLCVWLPCRGQAMLSPKMRTPGPIPSEEKVKWADSIYFLGFIITLVALISALTQSSDALGPPAEDGEDPLEKALEATRYVGKVIVQNAIALSSTVAALILRSVLVQSIPTGDDSLDGALRKVREATDGISGAVIDFKKTVEDLDKETYRIREAMIASSSKMTDAGAAMVAGMTNALQAHETAVAQRIEALFKPLEERSKVGVTALENLVRRIDGLEIDAQALTDAARAAFAPAGDAAAAVVVEAMAPLRPASASAGGALEGFAAQLGAVRIEERALLEEAGRAFALAAEAARRSLLEALGPMRDAFGAAAGEIETSSAKAARAVQDLGERLAETQLDPDRLINTVEQVFEVAGRRLDARLGALMDRLDSGGQDLAKADRAAAEDLQSVDFEHLARIQFDEIGPAAQKAATSLEAFSRQTEEGARRTEASTAALEGVERALLGTDGAVGRLGESLGEASAESRILRDELAALRLGEKLDRFSREQSEINTQLLSIVGALSDVAERNAQKRPGWLRRVFGA